jgi:hypothetical protein
MAEPLVNDTDLQDGLMKAVLNEDGAKGIESIKSLLGPAIRSTGYSAHPVKEMQAKSLCALIQCLNAIPQKGPKYRDNILFIVIEFRKNL